MRAFLRRLFGRPERALAVRIDSVPTLLVAPRYMTLPNTNQLADFGFMHRSFRPGERFDPLSPEIDGIPMSTLLQLAPPEDFVHA